VTWYHLQTNVKINFTFNAMTSSDVETNILFGVFFELKLRVIMT